MTRPRIAIVVSAVALLACACTPAATSSTPVAPTVYRCSTPTPGAECSKEQHDQEVARKALFDEASKVYREVYAERMRLHAAGGSETANDYLRARAGGTYLVQISKMLQLQFEAKQSRRGEGSTSVVGEISPKPETLIGLETCDDGRAITVYGPNGDVVGRGGLVRARSYFSREDGLLKIVAGEGEVVEQCGAAS